MKDTFFDKRLKASLENLEAPYDPASWNALEHRLNAPIAEEHPSPVDNVDKAVFRTLDRLEASYQPAHWDMLAGRMNQAARVRRRLWIMKISEAAIFLLLLANFDGFLRIGSNPETPAPRTPASQRLQAEARSRHHKNNISAAAIRDNSGPEPVSTGILQTEENYIDMQALNGSNILTTDPFETLSDLTLNATSAAAVLLNPTETPTPEHWASLPAIVKLPILLGSPLESSENRAFSAPVAQTIKSPGQHRFYASTYGSYDWNHVSSTDYVHSANGYGGGMAIGYRIGKWGVEAGLAYNRKQYEPKREEEIYKGNTQNGYYGSYAKTVDADLVSVPVKVMRRLGQLGQLSAHAVGGITTNFVLDKSYQYSSTYYPGQAPPDPNFSPGQQPQLRQKGRGLLEKGTLDGNVYVSADAGVRLEHPLGRHFVAFVEPVYRHAIGGKSIGPNPAKINTFSVQAGVLATL